MNIFRQLEKEHSNQNSLRIVSYIGDDAERFAELMHCFFLESEEPRISQRAAHVLAKLFDKKPHLVAPYLEKLIDMLNSPNLSSPLKRNIVRLLQFSEIPENKMGQLYDSCYGFLANPKEEIAIRVFSMVVLYNISEKYLDLGSELQLLVETVLAEPHSSPGIQSKGKKILNKLIKQK